MSSTATTAALKHKCSTCSKCFRTKYSQRQHFKAKHAPGPSIGTETQQRAQQTQVLAITQEARGEQPAAHQTGSSSSSAQARPLPKTGSTDHVFPLHFLRALRSIHDPTSSSADTIVHRNIRYTSLSTAEEYEILPKLAETCHAHPRLLSEGYQLSEGKATGKTRNAIPDPLRHLPEPAPSRPRFGAIVLDCEMGMTDAGHNELTHLAVVEFFSGRVLIDRLVKPSTPITNWNTHITGIDADVMQRAVDRNEALSGWQAARAALWAIADSNTIIIGQSAFYDLHVLRTAHGRVIDSAILTADAVLGDKPLRLIRRWSLQELCKQLLRINIRHHASSSSSAAATAGTHDPLEDTLAARELVIFCLRYPEKLEAWAKSKAGESHSRQKKKKKKKGTTPVSVDAAVAATTRQTYHVLGLQWEDVIAWPM